jgi:hypothetical protein
MAAYAVSVPAPSRCLKLEHEFNHTTSKLRILGFESLKQSLIAWQT